MKEIKIAMYNILCLESQMSWKYMHADDEL